MAKVPYSKLGLKIKSDIKTIKYNGLDIEVKQYLSTTRKLDLMSKVINQSIDELNYSNPVKVEVFLVLEVIKAYTNINFTEKQLEDPCKLYDSFINSGLYSIILENIEETEINSLKVHLFECIDAIYAYRNSLIGMLENINVDYDALQLQAIDINSELSNPNNLTLLKNVMTQLG